MKKSLSDHHAKHARTALALWLGESSAARAELCPVPGGLSGAEIWRVQLGLQIYCLRRWPPHQSDPLRLEQIHAFQRHVGLHGCTFVPALVPSRSGATWEQLVDSSWELAAWMRGNPDYTQTPNAEKRDSAVTALARLHAVAARLPLRSNVASVGRSPGLVERAERIQSLNRGGLAELSHRVASTGSRGEIADVARELLTRLHHGLPAVNDQLVRIATYQFPLGWCLRDIHEGNLLFEGNLLSGLVDFGAVAIDSVAGDLARLVRSLAEGDSNLWRDCLCVYQSLRPLSPLEIESIRAFDQVGIVCAAANWLRWIFLERRPLAEFQTVAARLRLLALRLEALDASSCLAS